VERNGSRAVLPDSTLEQRSLAKAATVSTSGGGRPIVHSRHSERSIKESELNFMNWASSVILSQVNLKFSVTSSST